MSNDNRSTISSLPYAEWLEQTLKDLIDIPVRGLCIAAVTENDESYTNYWKTSMADKLVIAGLIQQDAMFDALAANGIIDYEDDEEDVNGEEEK